jgi:hypothetical protein
MNQMKKLLLVSIVLLFTLVLSSGLGSTEYTILAPEDEVPDGTLCVPMSGLGAYNVTDDGFGQESTVGKYVWIAPIRP